MLSVVEACIDNQNVRKINRSIVIKEPRIKEAIIAL
jgi:hypothetical protein